MKIVIAIDSFKGSLTSLEAGTSCADGIRRVMPEADIVVSPSSHSQAVSPKMQRS